MGSFLKSSEEMAHCIILRGQTLGHHGTRGQTTLWAVAMETVQQNDKEAMALIIFLSVPNLGQQKQQAAGGEKKNKERKESLSPLRGKWVSIQYKMKVQEIWIRTSFRYPAGDYLRVYCAWQKNPQLLLRSRKSDQIELTRGITFSNLLNHIGTVSSSVNSDDNNTVT